MDLSKIKRVHFIGIGGIGMNAVAKLMLKIGTEVRGSDAENSKNLEELQKMGAVVYAKHCAENLRGNTDLVIYSLAIPKTNPERIKVANLGITEMSYPQFLGEISRRKKTIAVSGTNGKSTTTAIIGTILRESGMRPTVIVGSRVKNFEDGNLEIGDFEKGPFVVEACEYKAAMLNLSPEIIILTNIEADHLDFYDNLEHIKKTFEEYVSLGKKIVVNADDEASLGVLKSANIVQKNIINYGIKNLSVDIRAENLRIANNFQFFNLVRRNKNLGNIQLRVPGVFNIYNALAAISAGLLLGVPFENIQKSIRGFKGIYRRFEVVEDNGRILVISDYAHHPTAIQGTIRAAREFYPHRRIVVVFQPHSWNRTKNLFNEFARSFNEADLTIIPEVYYVNGRENDKDKISSQDLVEAICKNTARAKEKIFYAENLDTCRDITKGHLRNNDLVLLMGAGDIYKIKPLLG